MRTIDRDEWGLRENGRMHDVMGWAAAIVGGSLLGYGLIKRDRAGWAAGAAGAAMLYRGVVMTRDPEPAFWPDTSTTVEVRRTVSIQRPVKELFEYWARPENLPTFMIDVESVRETSPGRQHWAMRFPMGMKLEFDTEVAEHRDERIEWQTVDDSPLEHFGAVEFREGTHPSETIVRLHTHYVLPGGLLTRGFAMMAGRDPEQMARENLRRFKQLMEAGEIATTEGQPTGRSKLRNRLTESLYHENIGRSAAREHVRERTA